MKSCYRPEHLSRATVSAEKYCEYYLSFDVSWLDSLVSQIIISRESEFR